MTSSVDLYQRAIIFAALAHGDQTVPGKPFCYVTHVAQVALEVIAAVSEVKYLNPDLAVPCAILHDVLEDTQVTAEELEREFGVSVQKGVAALTKNRRLPKNARMRDSLQRILSEPPEVGIVKMADRICNLQEPPEQWLPDKIAEYHDEAVVIYRALKHLNAQLADRLKTKIDEYGQYLI